MRKLALSLLALVLLASTAVAAPEGWERINGAWRSTGVQNDAQAQERGGEFYLNLEELRLEMYPWRDGSGDVLTMRPVLPPGTKVVRPDGAPVRDGLAEVPYGWRADLEGGALDGVVLRLMDLQGDKVPEALDDFLAPGLALIYTFDAADVPTSGEWIPKRIRFDGIANDCSFYIQPTLTQQEIDDGATQPKWSPGSIAIYHASKGNNRGFKKYTTGKIAHLPRPLMVGRNANGITGYAFGHYVEVSHGVFDKVFDMDAILAAPSQTLTKFSIGQPTKIHVSADLGYNTVGTLGFTFPEFVRLLGEDYCLATEDGTITSFSMATAVTSVTHKSFIYSNGATSPPTTLLENIKSGVEDSSSDAGGGKFWIHDVVADVAMTSGNYYFAGFNMPDSSVTYYRDSGVVGDYLFQSQAYATSPLATGSFSEGDSLFSQYISYDPAVSPPITTNAALTDATPTRGDSITLTADATSDNAITKMEYYIGADPGEDAGIDLTLTPTSGTSVSGSIVIDTTSITSGAYTVSVRSFDAVGGWGAVDTVGMTVSLPSPSDFAGTGADEAVELTWTEVTGATSYTITHGTTTGPGGAGGQITGLTGGSYTHTGRVNGTEYFYVIAALDGGTNSANSAEISVVANPPDAAGGAGLNLSIGLEL